MIHPDTRLRYLHPRIGYGLIATAHIPRGSIVYVQDALDVVIPPQDARLQDPNLVKAIERYTYQDEKGNQILCWDFAKYVNHCCQANCLSTGFGFEIAIRDIQPGEEITDDYAMFAFDLEMPLICERGPCRNMLRPGDFELLCDRWDDVVRAALPAAALVPQPLLPYLDPQTTAELEHFLQTGVGYRPVHALRPRSRAVR